MWVGAKCMGVGKYVVKLHYHYMLLASSIKFCSLSKSTNLQIFTLMVNDTGVLFTSGMINMARWCGLSPQVGGW